LGEKIAATIKIIDDKDAGNEEEACELLHRFREIYGKAKQGVSDYRRIAAGQTIVSAQEIASAVAAGKPTAAQVEVLKKFAERPEILKDLCEEDPERCGQFLRNNPQVARIIKERAPEVIEEALEKGATNTEELAGIYKISKERIQEKLAERIEKVEQRENVVRARIAIQKEAGEAIRTAVAAEKASTVVENRIGQLQRINERLEAIKRRNIQITVRCRNAVASAIQAGVEDEEKLIEICRAGVFTTGVSPDVVKPSTTSAGDVR